jgi:hypothetical protein
MRYFRKMAVATAAAGLAVFGAMAAGGGVANAATSQVAVSCSASAVVLEAGVLSSCTEGATTVINPTSFTLTTSAPGLAGSLATTLTSALSGLGLSDVNTLVDQLTTLTENVSFTLACTVNGQTVTKAESYSGLTDGATETIGLQAAVGSPVPNSCQVQGFTVQSPVSLSPVDAALISGLPSTLLSPLSPALGLLGLGSTPLAGLTGTDLTDLLALSVSATLTANTAVPGAIWTGAAKTSGGLDADICADDAGNGNAAAIAQVYQCNSDLAQSWTQASTGRLVRNGDCITQQGAKVSLQKCSATNAAQVWNVKGTGGNFNEIVNSSSGQCLTAAKAVNFTQLTGATCTGKANQKWTGPAKSAA